MLPCFIGYFTYSYDVMYLFLIQYVAVYDFTINIILAKINIPQLYNSYIHCSSDISKIIILK